MSEAAGGATAPKGPSEGLPAALKKAVPWKELAIAVAGVAIASIGLIAQLHGLALPNVPIHGLGSIPLYPVFYLTGGAIIFGRLAQLGVQSHRQGKPAAQARLRALTSAEQRTAAPAAKRRAAAAQEAQLVDSGKGYIVQRIGDVKNIRCLEDLESKALYATMGAKEELFGALVEMIAPHASKGYIKLGSTRLLDLAKPIKENLTFLVKEKNVPSAAVKIKDTIYVAGREALVYTYDPDKGVGEFSYLGDPNTPKVLKKEEGSKIKQWVVLGSDGLREAMDRDPTYVVNRLNKDTTPSTLAADITAHAQRDPGTSAVGVTVVEL